MDKWIIYNINYFLLHQKRSKKYLNFLNFGIRRNINIGCCKYVKFHYVYAKGVISKLPGTTKCFSNYCIFFMVDFFLNFLLLESSKYCLKKYLLYFITLNLGPIELRSKYKLYIQTKYLRNVKRLVNKDIYYQFLNEFISYLYF